MNNYDKGLRHRLSTINQEPSLAPVYLEMYPNSCSPYDQQQTWTPSIDAQPGAFADPSVQLNESNSCSPYDLQQSWKQTLKTSIDARSGTFAPPNPSLNQSNALQRLYTPSADAQPAVAFYPPKPGSNQFNLGPNQFDALQGSYAPSTDAQPVAFAPLNPALKQFIKCLV